MGVKYFRDVALASPAEMWAAAKHSEVQFVDGDYGGDNGGTSPKRAMTTITKAVTNLTGMRNTVIYVRPKGTAAAAQTYYTDNVTIPVTCAGMSIIGAGANSVRPFLGVDVKAVPVTGVTSPVITILAAGCHLEGMRLAGTGQTAGYPIVQALASAGTGPVGLQIVNCRLDNAKTGGAIILDSPNHVEIVGCSFDECAIGITSSMITGGYASRGLKILDCDFGGRAATRTVDVYISQSGAGTQAGVTGYEIGRSRFLGLPTLAGAYSPRYITIANADVGLIFGCYFQSAVAGTYGNGDQATFATSWHIAGCFSGVTVANSQLGLIGFT